MDNELMHYRSKKNTFDNIHNLNMKKIFLSKINGLFKFLGPAFIVSVAYVDPGNFATNISAGSIFNYNLIWVILLSNMMAIFLQITSAKLGIATSHNLSEMCEKTFSRNLNWFFWIIAELAAMATTMAEFLGGALGIYLLFGIPLKLAGLITCFVTLSIICMQKYGQRVIEIIITVLVATISIAYTIELFLAKPIWPSVALHTLIPSLASTEAVFIAVGMLGATVMPHVIYLHSQLVQCRNKDMSLTDRKHHLKMEKIDIFIAMNIAFVVNAAMVIVSAAVFYTKGIRVESIEMAHQSLSPLLGSLSSISFAIALLASGFSSSAVGAMAGETVMDGFVSIKIPLVIKRIVTMAPALIIILIGINPMKALVMSQVCLSFALPVAIIPMMIITSRKDIMGSFVNKSFTKVIGWIIVSSIILLNCVLIYLTFTS